MEGMRFGKLRVLSPYGMIGHDRKWVCVCDCGNFTTGATGNLRSGRKVSCGCVRSRCKNESASQLYRVWWGMLKRCKFDPLYRDRGITVCQDWGNYLNFAAWAKSNGYSKELSIDRIDNDSGYRPDNCRWVDMSIQNRNKRNSVILDWNGMTRNALDWAEYFNVNPSRIYMFVRKFGKESFGAYADRGCKLRNRNTFDFSRHLQRVQGQKKCGKPKVQEDSKG